MNQLLRAAKTERKELMEKLEKIDKVIELLGGSVESKKHTRATRRKMREAWAKRKQQTPTEESVNANDGLN